MKKSKRKPQGATRTQVEQKPARRPISDYLDVPLKLFKLMAVCAVLAGVVLGGQRMLDGLDQPITRVEVKGDLKQLDKAAIAAWVQSQITEGVLSTDLRSLQAQLQGRPWIAGATVRRKWPGVLAVSLVEHEAVARWNEKALITEKGLVFEPAQLPVFEELPHLWGADSSAQEVLRQFHWLQQQFDELHLQVTGLSKAHRGAWQVELLAEVDEQGQQAGMVVALGKQDIAAKLERFRILYDSVLKARFADITRVDLRYTNGVAVQWKAAEAAGV
ncbi:MAG: cell division protein FtsQ/DivIB [Pseudomonadales bacterium]|jgi:cell division protein FtsQ